MMRPPSGPWGPIVALFAGITLIASITILSRTPGTPTVTPIDTAPAPVEVVPSETGACKRAGCSGQSCVDAAMEDFASTCEFRAEYACYRTATCARQSDGKCGWTQTTDLTACLKSPPAL